LGSCKFKCRYAFGHKPTELDTKYFESAWVAIMCQHERDNLGIGEAHGYMHYAGKSNGAWTANRKERQRIQPFVSWFVWVAEPK
jgi:hypothetical protein